VKLKIRVANPVSGQLTYISVKAAERYVVRGRARWRDERTIAFIEDTHYRQSAERLVQLEQDLAYDRVGAMTLEQIKGVPVIGDPMKLFTIG
jgi:hypothetical protein